MTDKQLKLIYEYMKDASSWKHDDDLIVGVNDLMQRPLDSNSAWECVQEMERKGDTQSFERILSNTHSEATEDINLRSDAVFISYFVWSRNPTNFFNCFAKWLEGKEKKKKDRQSYESLCEDFTNKMEESK